MDALTLAQEIIDGRRITREDDLNFFLTCDLKELCEGADRIRKACVGDKVDLCSIINGRSGHRPLRPLMMEQRSTDGVDDVQRTASTARSLHTTTQAARSMISFRKKRS